MNASDMIAFAIELIVMMSHTCIVVHLYAFCFPDIGWIFLLAPRKFDEMHMEILVFGRWCCSNHGK